METINGVTTKRERAQIVQEDFARRSAKRIEDLIISLQNPQRNSNRSFIQYTKDLIKQYLQSPIANIDNIRQVSRFLSRVSMLYKKFLSY